MKNPLRNLPAQFRWTALTTLAVLILLLCIMVVVSCSSDDEPDYLPPYEQMLCEVMTDAKGVATTIRFDDGRERPLVTCPDGLTPDSLYRISAAVLEDESGVSIYNAAMIFSPMPVVMKDEEVKIDPVDVLTVWRDIRYINLRLSIKRSATTGHFLTFLDDGVRNNSDGTCTYQLRLFHDSNADDDHFRDELIVSCPIYPFAEQLRVGVDSVCLTVNTPEGPQRCAMLY